MVKIANLMLVSFYFVVCCVPIVTIVPAMSSLFYTTTKVICESGDGVTKTFFKTFKASLKQGILLTLICLAITFFFYTAFDFGRQMWKSSLFGTAYFAVSLIVSFLFIVFLLYLGPVFSRFGGKIDVIIRLTLYFCWKKPLRTVLMLITFAICAFIVWFYPIALILIPGLYTDLIRNGIENTFRKYMEENGLKEVEEEETEVEEDEDDTQSNLAFDRLYEDKDDRK